MTPRQRGSDAIPTTGAARRLPARLPRNGAPSEKTAPLEENSQYPSVLAVASSPLTGLASFVPATEPWNAASPKVNTPPSDATRR